MGDNEQQSFYAKEAVERFVARFTPAYQDLLYHAALPLVLTPELLNYLRSEFLADRVDWVAEADLLLSDLCQEIGYEQYAMRLDVRAQLLARMQKSLGEQRMQEVARRLLAWVHHLAQTNPRIRPHELQTQQWAAMVYLQEKRGQAVQEISQALQQCKAIESDATGQANWNTLEMSRLSNVITDLAHQLQDYPDLVRYAELTTKILCDNSGQVARELKQRTVNINVGSDEIKLTLPLHLPPTSKSTILVGEILRGTVESIDYLTTLSGAPNLECPLRINIDLGAVGKGIAPPSDYLSGGRFHIKPGDKIDVVVTFPPNKEGKIGVANSHAFRVESLHSLRHAAITGDSVIGRVGHSRQSNGPQLEFGEIIPTLNEANRVMLYQFLGHEVAVLITHLDKNQLGIAISFGQAERLCEVQRLKTATEYLQEGVIVEGRITKVDNEFYGLVVDLGGMTGVVPKEDIDYQSFTAGEYILAKVISLDREGEKAILSLKELQINAENADFTQHEIGDLVSGIITSHLPHGVSVLLANNIKGYCPYAEFAYWILENPADFVQINREYLFRVLRLDYKKKELLLTLSGQEKLDQLELEIRKAINQYQEQLGERLVDVEATTRQLTDARMAAHGEVILELELKLAAIFFEIKDFQTAKKLYFLARLLTHELNNARSEYIATFNLGEIEKALGNNADALEYFDEAIEVAKKQTLTAGETQAWIRKSKTYQQLSNWSNALQCYEEALQCAYRSLDDEAVKTIFAQISEIFPRTNDPQTLAVDFYQRQWGLAGEANLVGELLAASHLAEALAAKKNYESAIYYARFAIGSCAQLPNWSEAGIISERLLALIKTWDGELIQATTRGGDGQNYGVSYGHKILNLTPFEFETVMLNARGKEIARKRLKAQQFIEDLGNGITLEMVDLPSGTFLMGAPDSERQSRDIERPQHKVIVSPFYMSKFTITQAQWRLIAEDQSLKAARELLSEPSFFKGDTRGADFTDDDRRPVEQISWDDAVEFCARLSKKTGRAYRLPTEAEWEYACRAGTTTPFAFGATITPEVANYNGSFPYDNASYGKNRVETIPVGVLGVANAFGLFDMHGNVWEWCQDWSGDYSSENQTDPTGPTDGEFRLLRGGSWRYYGLGCRSANRHIQAPGTRSSRIGFRCLVSAKTNRVSQPEPIILEDWNNQILWVDDRPQNNVYEREMFENKGMLITFALTTNEALALLSQQRFAIIISDMGRREGPREGYVLLDTVRQQGNQTPLFFYASSDAPEHKKETLEHGGQGCTNNPKELLQMVMQALQTSNQ